MAKAADRGIEPAEGKSVLNAGNQKQVERLLKKSADQAAKQAKRKWKSAGRNPFSRNANARMGGIEKALTNALKGALNFHANNSGPRPSIKMTAPDTGGRPFHFSHTTVNASGASKTYRPGTTAAHMSYIDRESAVEQAMLEEGVDLSLSSREIYEEAFGRDPAERMQGYIEDAEKVEAAKAAQAGQAPQPLAFTFGNIGDTKEERRAFWQLVEDHPERGNARLQSRVILELPVESTPAQRVKIVKEYVKGLEERGLRYHGALHAPTDKNDPRNYHAHIIYMARPAEKVDFAFDGLDDGTDKPKAKVWDFAAVTKIKDEFRVTRTRYFHRQTVDPETRSKKFIPNERKRLAEIVNAVMAEAGNPVRYDPRSYKAMGIEVEAMRSISRIVADKAKDSKRVILDEGRTKRDIEAEVRRLAQERAPEYAEVSRIRAAVRTGHRQLRQLEKEGSFLKKKPILRRGAHGVKTYVKSKALDYARTRALHVERSIEAAQEIRSVERVVEATKPEVIALLRARLARSLLDARAKGNKKEVARLKKEMAVVPKTALAALLHGVAKSEVEILKARNERAGASRMARVRQAMRDWRAAALGAKPDLTPTAPQTAIRTGGIAVNAAARTTEAPAMPKPKEHPMWASYDDIVDDVFKTGFQKYMWGVNKRYTNFILENADNDVPGRTPLELAAKLIEAVKQHPAKAEELIMSYQNGRQVPQPGAFSDGPTRPTGAQGPIEDAPPVFKQRARMPGAAPGEVQPFPYDLTPLEPITPLATPLRSTAPADEAKHVPPNPPPSDEATNEPAKAKRKDRERKKERRRVIMIGRGRER
ncbi:MobA/MobL family protein [Bosea sp. RAC05]|uniref:MobA/MobL family protein n=1 Tax=Bosea sp. RAC05 TaxID=1842539 RepID=UPI00083D9C8A|nr:MobA/MobL family protein [Bosea sp. RAC05]AOG04515.1 mobA/MobL family protein [Bosea sp. RAC05]